MLGHAPHWSCDLVSIKITLSSSSDAVLGDHSHTPGVREQRKGRKGAGKRSRTISAMGLNGKRMGRERRKRNRMRSGN